MFCHQLVGFVKTNLHTLKMLLAESVVVEVETF